MLTELVVDASFSMCWFLKDEINKASLEIFAKLEKYEVSVLVPALWVTETVTAFIQAERRKRIEPEATRIHLENLQYYPIKVITPPLTSLLQIAELARKYNLSGYDAAYLNLAMELNLPLATLDEKLTLAASAAGVKLAV